MASPPSYEECVNLSNLSNNLNLSSKEEESQAEGVELVDMENMEITESLELNDIQKIKKRVYEINSRLLRMGYLDDPVECPEFLNEFEQVKSLRSGTVCDAVAYKSRMDLLSAAFHKAKAVLASKVDELVEKGILKDDIPDYVWKEESDGLVKRFTIREYYDAYQIAAHYFVKFIETTVPVNYRIIFVEKNILMGEKIDLLVKMRSIELSQYLS
jgi:hypothetical protein